MPELSIHNIDQIVADIRKQDITYNGLADELVDHICCEVEKQMECGLSFADAYKRVRKMIGQRRLKEIQEETLYAVDTKYRRMKNLMKISAIAGTVLLGFASLFKIQHWAGAGMMMTLGALILAFLFMPSALGVLWKETHNRRRIMLFISSFLASTLFILGTLFKIQHWPGAGWILLLALASAVLLLLPSVLVYLISDQDRRTRRGPYIMGAAGFVLFITGLLFKIQHWPFATILLVTGLIVLGITAIPWYVYLKWKEESFITSGFIYLIIASLLIIIPAMMINLNLQYAFEDGYYPHLERQQAMHNYLFSKNNSLLSTYKDSTVYSRMEKIHSATNGLLSMINDIEERMISEAEGEPGKPIVLHDQMVQGENGPEIRYRMLSKPFHPAPYRDFLFPGTSSRSELDQSVADYKTIVMAILNDNGYENYSDLLDTPLYLPAEQRTGQDMSLLSALHAIELLKNSILTVEHKALSAITAEGSEK